MKRVYIATSIPYVNGDPHIGFALELLYADVFARFQRTQGYDVRFVTGSDEHGLKIAQTAEKLGRTAQLHVDTQSIRFRKLCPILNISNTDFIRTTEERHARAAKKLWTTLVEKGYIEKRTYNGRYCVGCEAFKTEKELVEDSCPNHPNLVMQEVAEENYFFLLSQLQNNIEEYYKTHPDFVIPGYRFHEMKEFISNDLQDVSISREKEKIQWGIPVPGDEGQLMYVWFEALINYMAAVGYGTDDLEFAQQWPAEVIFVGKDINRFHSVMFLGMLLAASIQPPKQIAVHGHITADGQKMSKSLGNVVDPFEIVQKYGVDTVRYFLLSQIAMQNDGDFSEERLREVYAAHLQNGLGNLCTRVTDMIEKFCQGIVPTVSIDAAEVVDSLIIQFQFDQYLSGVWAQISFCNQEIQNAKPWELVKTDPATTQQWLGRWYHKLVRIAQELAPFMPDTSQKMLAHLADPRHITKMPPLFPRLS